MLQKVKLPAAFILCMLLLYIWGFFLAVGGMGQMLFAAYMIVGFTLCSVFFRKKRLLREYIYLAAVFGLFAGLVDLSLTAVSVPSLILLSLADMAFKVGLSIAGGAVFFAFSRAYSSKRKFLKTDLGVFSRRLVAALVDWNAILLIVFALSFSALLAPELGNNLMFIVSVETIVIFAYKAVQEAFDGKTIGKKVAGIRVKGKPWQAFLRNFILVLFGITMFPGVMGSPLASVIYILMLGDIILFFTGRRLFDILAGTSVERSEESIIQVKGRPRIRFTFG